MSKVFRMTLAALYRHQHPRKMFALTYMLFILQQSTFQSHACIFRNQVLCLRMKHTEGVSFCLLFLLSDLSKLKIRLHLPLAMVCLISVEQTFDLSKVVELQYHIHGTNYNMAHQTCSSSKTSVSSILYQSNRRVLPNIFDE